MMPGMPAPPPPPPLRSQSQRSYEEQLGMGEALQSATIISFPVLFPVDLSCQKEGEGGRKKKNPLNGRFPQGEGGKPRGSV